MRTNFCENVKKKSLLQPPKQGAKKALLTYAVETLLADRYNSSMVVCCVGCAPSCPGTGCSG